MGHRCTNGHARLAHYANCEDNCADVGKVTQTKRILYIDEFVE